MKKVLNIAIIVLISVFVSISFLSSYGEQNGGKHKKCGGLGKYMPNPAGTANVLVCPAPESTDSCYYPCVSNNNND